MGGNRQSSGHYQYFFWRTGCLIAKRANELGAKVKLLLGPGRLDLPKNYFKGIDVTRFYYFKQLLHLIKKEVTTKKYDAIIHSAAVSDYAPIKTQDNKISSGKENLIIRLKPTLKIIQQIKKWVPKIFLVQFKLEVDKNYRQLIDISYKSMLKNKADLVVVNDLNSLNKAYIIDLAKKITKVNNRLHLADILLKIMK